MLIRRDTRELTLSLSPKCPPGRGHIKTQGAGGHLQAKKRALTRTLTLPDLDLRLAASKL